MAKKNRLKADSNDSYLKLYSLIPGSDQVYQNSARVKNHIDEGEHVIQTKGKAYRISSIIVEKPGVQLEDKKAFELSKLLIRWWYNKKKLSYDESSFDFKEFAPLHTSDFQSYKDPIYKYVPEEIYDRYIKRGIWQFGTLAQYQKIENVFQRDPLEGYANIRLSRNNQGLAMFCSSTNNHCMLCCTDQVDSLLHRNKFGEVRITINQPFEFSREAARSIGVRSWDVKKVHYNSIKFLNHTAKIFTPDLGEDPLIDHLFLDRLVEVLKLPSIFIKTIPFKPESEVRMIFELKKDPRKPVRIQNLKLNQFITVD